MEPDAGEYVEEETACPRRLPIIEINGKKYFVDERLHQLRNVNDPFDCMNFYMHCIECPNFENENGHFFFLIIAVGLQVPGPNTQVLYSRATLLVEI